MTTAPLFLTLPLPPPHLLRQARLLYRCHRVAAADNGGGTCADMAGRQAMQGDAKCNTRGLLKMQRKMECASRCAVIRPWHQLTLACELRKQMGDAVGALQKAAGGGHAAGEA